MQPSKKRKDMGEGITVSGAPRDRAMWPSCSRYSYIRTEGGRHGAGAGPGPGPAA